MEKSTMGKIGGVFKKYLPKNIGFCLLIFDFSKPGKANYMSNANRQDMIKALFETAYRLKENQNKTP